MPKTLKQPYINPKQPTPEKPLTPRVEELKLESKGETAATRTESMRFGVEVFKVWGIWIRGLGFRVEGLGLKRVL